MRIDIDTYKEILDTLTRNKSRSILTGFGVFWGVFMLVGLFGGGKGLEELLSKNFEGFATNSAIIFAENTTKPYAGYRKGRQWSMEYKDVDRLKAQVPELDVVSPMVVLGGNNAVFNDKKTSCYVKGVLPEYARVETPKLRYGRFLNDMDMQQHRKVCVDSIYYSVVGVDYASGNMSVGGGTDESIVIPITLMQQAYNLGNTVHLISVTGKPGVKMSSLTTRIRGVIARSHRVDPTDEKAISMFNSEAMFSMVDNLFSGVNFLIWLVGIGTLLAGAIGVSNIMMVTVRERTTEIGIRRAIGATPRNILSQIISESILLTAVSGMSGLLFAVVILQLAELANTTDGIVSSHFQIGFWTAVGAVVLLSILGILAGLAPAARAMSIKPVDAMRDG